LPKDKGSYDSLGRINLELLEALIPNLHQADYYMCGNSAFMADVEEMLQLAGVDPHRIQTETF
jgi:ferredoxin-NADP reductase